jgi:hypothetical protein
MLHDPKAIENWVVTNVYKIEAEWNLEGLPTFHHNPKVSDTWGDVQRWLETFFSMRKVGTGRPAWSTWYAGVKPPREVRMFENSFFAQVIKKFTMLCINPYSE